MTEEAKVIARAHNRRDAAAAPPMTHLLVE